MTAWSYWLARLRLHRRGTRDDALVSAWLHANPTRPIEAAYRDLPLPGRRVRRAVARLTGDAEGATR